MAMAKTVNRRNTNGQKKKGKILNFTINQRNTTICHF